MNYNEFSSWNIWIKILFFMYHNNPIIRDIKKHSSISFFSCKLPVFLPLSLPNQYLLRLCEVKC
ncbi:unnamed protein product [Leptospira phage LE1]|uniref:Uncharacterized protein n=1 Tax=Leptospira phage LE1 TaxID=137511 RepID=Q6NE25_9CAUD|nr:hypothetical protein HWD53_gp18 [Leptospira phage LE1]CAE14685.1 unnamed protein product [Leptospira phage LE1]